MVRRLGGLVALCAIAIAAPPLPVPPALGQDSVDPGLLGRCETASLPTPRERALCRDVAVAIQILQPEAGMALVGGNPVLGTANTLGARFRVIPRMNIAGRLTFVFVDLPNVIDYPSEGTLGFTTPTAQLDLSVGVFKGLDLTTTLGGFASVELLGSLGTTIYPAGDGFLGDAAGYGLGARIGIIRESFTAPGISVSVFRKWASQVEFGGVSAGDDSQFGMDLRAWSLRAGLSKSFVSVGVAFTLGWDSYSSDVEFAISDLAGNPIPLATEADPVELTSDRWSASLDLSYILLFFNFVAELGWQETETLTLSNGDELESGKLFGAIGVRLTL